jgi:DNA polymerase III delta prime subunit
MGLVQKQYDDFIWELKYRPPTLDQIILPDSLLKLFSKVKSIGKLPNMLFTGPAGTGKTTTAFVLADEMDLSAMYMNMSLDTKIDDIRSKLMSFATSISIHGKQKVFIGDEFDRLSPQAMDSLKGAIEKTSKNCKFIFTSNHKGKIIEPIISRLQEIDFIFKKDDAAIMKKKMWKVACQICQKEEVEFDKRAVAEIVKQLFPDMRKILNHLQMLSLRGEITVAAVEAAIATDVETFFKMLRDQDWTGIRQYIVDLPIAHNDFYSVIFSHIERYVLASSVPDMIIAVAKYQYEAAYAVDKQIPLAALAIEMMGQCEFKKDF